MIIARLREWRLKNIRKDAKGKYWRTNKHNKIAIYDHLRDLICEEDITTVSKYLWSELRVIETGDNGVPNAAVRGSHDDLTMATCLALWMAKMKPAPSFFQVKRELIEEFKKKAKARKIREFGPLPFRPAGVKYG